MRKKKKSSIISLNALVGIILSVIVLVFLTKAFASFFFNEPVNLDIVEDNARSVTEFVEFSAETYGDLDGCYTMLKLENLANFQLSDEDKKKYVYYITEEKIEVYNLGVYSQLGLGSSTSFTGRDKSTVEEDIDEKLSNIEPEMSLDFPEKINLKIIHESAKEQVDKSPFPAIGTAPKPVARDPRDRNTETSPQLSLKEVDGIFLKPVLPSGSNLQNNRHILRGYTIEGKDYWINTGESNDRYLVYEPGSKNLFLSHGIEDERYVKSSLCKWREILNERRKEMFFTEQNYAKTLNYNDVVYVNYTDTKSADWKITWNEMNNLNYGGKISCLKIRNNNKGKGDVGRATVKFYSWWGWSSQSYEIEYGESGKILKVFDKDGDEITTPLQRGPFYQISKERIGENPRSNFFNYISYIKRNVYQKGDEHVVVEFSNKKCIGEIGNDVVFDTCGGKYSYNNKEKYFSFVQEYRENSEGLTCRKIKSNVRSKAIMESEGTVEFSDIKSAVEEYFSNNVRKDISFVEKKEYKSRSSFLGDVLEKAPFQKVTIEDLDKVVGEEGLTEEYGDRIKIYESNWLFDESNCDSDLCSYIIYDKRRRGYAYFYDDQVKGGFVKFDEFYLEKNNEKEIYFNNEKINSYERKELRGTTFYKIMIDIPTGEGSGGYPVILSPEQFERIPPEGTLKEE